MRSIRVLAFLLPCYLALPLLALPLAVSPSSLLDHLLSPMALKALVLTLGTTTAATMIVVALGTPLAYVLARVDFRGRNALDTLVDLPIAIPPVVAGVALLLAFGRRGLLGSTLSAIGLEIPFTTLAVVLAQVFIASPFFVKAARAGFESIDPRLEEAASTLGATPGRVFWTITLPLAGRGLLAGTVLAWARALSEFGATMMFAGNLPGRTQTLTLAVMSAMESDLDTAVAISLLAIALAFATLLVGKRLAATKEIWP